MSRGVQSQQLVQRGRILRDGRGFQRAIVEGFVRLQLNFANWEGGAMITAHEASRSCAQSSAEATRAFRRPSATRKDPSEPILA